MSLNHYIDSMPKPRLFQTLIAQLTHPSLEKVLIITVDGRTLTGTLVSCDQVTNLVLADTVERIIREQGDDEPSTEQPHGLYLVRGDIGRRGIGQEYQLERGEGRGDWKHNACLRQEAKVYGR